MIPARKIICALIAIALILIAARPSAAQAAQKSVTVLNYITGWELDGSGYHPAVFMLLENTSGRDLINVSIKFQARFTDLQTAEVTVGRKEFRKDLKAHQQFSYSLRSSEPFELPYDVQMWPKIEAKVMCRVGDVGDEGTETLLIAKVDETAHSEDEAFQSLNQATSYAPKGRGIPATPQPRPSVRQHERPVEKPLVASAEHFKATHAKTTPAAKNIADGGALNWLTEKSIPGLGDDFYLFEQRFGLPREFDAKHNDWTWARYQEKNSGAEIVAGAQERHGDVSVVIARIPKSAVVDAVGLANYARNLSGKFHAQSLSPASRSVRYLSTGRLELIRRNAPGYRVLCMSSPVESDNSFILILARAPQDVEQLLAAQSRKSSLLSGVRFLENSSDK